MGQEPGHGLAGPLAQSPLVTLSSRGLTGEASAFKGIHIVGRIHFLITVELLVASLKLNGKVGMTSQSHIRINVTLYPSISIWIDTDT